MKKLFALVLTLALVFAIAAPAMALSWGAEADDPGAPYKAAVSLLTKSTNAAGLETYVDYNNSIGVVNGTTVYFFVSFTVPTTAELAAYYAGADDAGTLAASVALKNISADSIVAQYKDGVEITSTLPFAVASNKVEMTIGNMTNTTDKAIVYSAIIKGAVTKTENATVTATMGYSAKTAPTITVKGASGVKYTFAAPSSGTAVITGNQSTNPTKLTLPLDGAKNIVKGNWTLEVAGKEYTVAAGPTFMYLDSTVIKELTPADGATYTAVKAAYDELVAILGFSVGAKDISFTAANIAANYGVAKTSSDVKTYKAYTANLTVTDGTNVPNTGDNMSVIGFVMVGLALLATAAVVVKKVRA